jgi:hypothetical protein
MKTTVIILHCLNIVAGAVVASGHGEWWMGVIVVASAGVGTYLSSQLPGNPPNLTPSPK